MIRLTEKQTNVYECIKKGANNTKAIGTLLGKKGQTIQRTATILEQYGLISKTMNGSSWIFIANDIPFETVTKILREDISPDDEPRGKLNLSGFEISLTEYQKGELAAYRATKKDKRTEERTPFAKRIGVPKLYLNFYLQLKEA